MSLRTGLVSSRKNVLVAVATSLAWLTGVVPGWADTLATPIAVPLIGTQGVAAAYPSTQLVVARGGPTQTATDPIRVVLHRVTHPCPEDLAVLLVHDNTQKYLLMSNAGGCRPLEGTTIILSDTGVAIPDTQPASPAYGTSVIVGVSNYAAPPVFPAPAPAGPYATHVPPVGTVISGRWDLYVMDTNPANRGVIAGGWSLTYNTEVEKDASQTLVALPGSGTGPGGAAAFPITFDLSGVPEGVPVKQLQIEIVLRHEYSDDVRIGLESPAGTVVVLMANAGGVNVMAPGTTLTFVDGGGALPNSTPIASGTYQPTSYAPVTLGPDGPAPPYATTLAAFNDQPLRGIWKLWAYDDSLFQSGQITSATLMVDTEVAPSPTLTPAPSATQNQPFVHVDGAVADMVSPHSADWRVSNGGVFYDAGPFTFTPGTNVFSADIPLKKGSNTVSYRVMNTRGESLTSNFSTTVDEFTYSFAEGATGVFFDLDVTLANPSAAPAPIAIDFLLEGGGTLAYGNTVNPNAPFPLSVDSVLPNAAVSTVVHSTDGVALAAERTMIWDASGYGGHGGTAVGPATRWLFAEGSQGFFNTFVLLANDNAADAAVTVKFLLEGGGAVTFPIAVPPKTRRTIFAGDIPELVNQSFGIDITSALPIIAERAMYLPGARLFEGGHESAGVNAPSKQWFLAEGATGSFFDCFVLLSNPNATDAHATITYLLPDGTTIVRAETIPANGRFTINLEGVDPLLANADVSTTIVADIGVVAERAMYWPNISVGWREAHNSFGVTSSGLRWGLADGRIGGPRAFQTFILLANPNPHPAEVVVRFLTAASTVTRTYTLNPSSRRSIYVNTEVPELGDGTFSADVQVVNYQPIAVEKALYWNAGAEVFAGGTNVTATRLPPP